MKKRWTAALLLGAQLVAQPAYAWDAIGHQVIARIAWDNMTPRARLAAVTLLSNAPADTDLRTLWPVVGPSEIRDRTYFVRASTWADLVRSTDRPERLRKYHYAPWHFTNYFFETTAQGTRDRTDLQPDTANIVVSLGRLETSIQNLSRASSLRAVDLAWVLHLVGDIHQPLHAAARVTAATPRGDQGGNLFMLDGRNNLHSYWDGLISRSVRRSASESEMAYVDRIAAGVVQRHPRTEFTSVLGTVRYEAWALAGSQLAKSQVYQTQTGREPSEAYRQTSLQSAESAAALAGYRLADLLNRTIGGGAAGASN